MKRTILFLLLLALVIQSEAQLNINQFIRNVRKALDTGAEMIAVACPQCAKMLDDAIKIEQLEDKLEVLDVAEMVTRYLS